jgi:hypothetical protein
LKPPLCSTFNTDECSLLRMSKGKDELTKGDSLTTMSDEFTGSSRLEYHLR